MDATVETATDRLRPFWGRVMVIPSNLDEEERPSGLIVPLTGESYTPIKRGVVAHVDRNVTGEIAGSMDDVGPGTVVYYVGGYRILDAVMLIRSEIVAYEVAE